MNSLEDVNQIAHYQMRALTMMQVYESEEKEAFYLWLNRFEYVTNILSIPEDKMVDFFNRMVDNEVHKLVCLKNQYVNVHELSYVRRINYYLQILYNLKKENPQRKRFESRNQYERESIKRYAENLRKLHNKCFYIHRADEILCEQFFNGISYVEIEQYYNKSLKLSFDETVRMVIELVKVDNYIYDAVSVIHTYSLAKECQFHTWLNKFEYVADMIGVPDNKMIEFFNKMVENDVHKCVREANSSIDFSELSYEKTIEYYFCKFDSFYEDDLYKARFFDRNQYEEERIEKYANSLQYMYNMCRSINRIEEKLCKKFINGCLNNELRKYLQKIPKLSFVETVAKATEFLKQCDSTFYVDRVLSMINIYIPSNEGPFYKWLNKFEYAADIVGVPDNKMVEVFNKMIYDDVYKCIVETTPYANFSELSYDEIIDHYYNYFFRSSEYKLHRIRFKCRYQYEEETILQYADNLRKLCRNCCYKTRFESKLCTQFIKGIRDNNIRVDLNKMPSTTFTKIVEEAINRFVIKEKI
ncbi:hypothetical protein M0804_014646 [Polistes exclamans]|nr:hypothetical protein M0804_014646 [Polistes exclamans]